MSSTATPTFSFSVWRTEPRQDTASHWNPESDPKRVSGRELAERLRAKRQAADKWEADHVRSVRPLRLRPPSQQQPVSGNGQAQQTPSITAEQDKIRLTPADFHPYGWAVLLWIGGYLIDRNAYHWMPYFWGVVALVGICLKRGPHYLFTSGVFVAICYFLLRNYLPL